jgi:HlyD family secretion protein
VAKTIAKRALRWLILAAALGIVGVLGFRYWKSKQNALPDGIVAGNGRLEGKLVDVAAKLPLRVKDVLVDEGDLVKPGQILVHLDTVTLESELAEANAEIAVAQEKLAVAKASIVKQNSEIKLAKVEAARSTNLVAEGAGSQRELDVRTTTVETTKASLSESQAMLESAKRAVEVAQESAATIQTRIDDATLKSPVTGRVLYRLAEPGEVVASGGKVLTLVNLEDIYMEIFLPSQQAASIKMGAEGRITVDYDPVHAVAGRVSFVSPEAQFTPKQVETRSEREKLMFRVKIQLPADVASRHLEQIKTGVRGMGYVKIKDSAVWPASLQNLLEPPASGPVAREIPPMRSTP